jgi:hypothetical protein
MVICQRLIDLNGGCHKSLNLHWPKLSDRFMSNFIRGYFDGDGCIYQKGSCIQSNISCGDKIFLEQLQTYLHNIDSCIVGHIYYSSNCYRLNFNQIETKHLGFIIYDNIPEQFYLKRKYAKFVQLYQEKGLTDYSQQCKLNNESVSYILQKISLSSKYYIKDIMTELNISRGSVTQILDSISWKNVSRNFDMVIIKSKIQKEQPLNINFRKRIIQELKINSVDRLFNKYNLSKTTLTTLNAQG